MVREASLMLSEEFGSKPGENSSRETQEKIRCVGGFVFFPKKNCRNRQNIFPQGDLKPCKE